ncbi:hypothetical protein [Ruminococcus sp.]|nr:hypothetical protein [Ruminococcus sp.]
MDKSFVGKINANESSKQYVAAMISMGHIIGLALYLRALRKRNSLKLS